MIAANQLFNLTKPDGLTIGIFNRGMPFAQLLKAEGVKFDLKKVSLAGVRIGRDSHACPSDRSSFQDGGGYFKVQRTRLMLGSAGGPSDSNTQFVMLLKEFAKLNVKIIDYPASAEAMLAVEQKEVDGRGASYSSIKPYVERNLVRCWIRGRVSEPGIENLPIDEDLTTDKMGKTIMAMRSATGHAGPARMSPLRGLRRNVLKILKEGIAKVLKDPEMKEDVKKNKMEMEYLPSGGVPEAGQLCPQSAGGHRQGGGQVHQVLIMLILG